MAVKEDAELKTIQRASQVTCDVFSKYLKEQIMEVIDNDKVTINQGPHYENTPMQHTAIFHGCKNDNFPMKN